MPRLNSKMKNIKHDLILEKASEMFESQGFEELKVSVLAKELGISVGTIYSYFESKEGLYGACVLVQIEQAYEMFKKLFDQGLDFEQLIERSVEIKFQAMSMKRKSLETGVLSNPFFFESQQIEHKDAFQKIYDLYIEPIEAIKKIDMDSMQLVYLLNAMGNSYILRWLEGDIDSLEGKAQEVTHLFITMIKGCQ